MPPDDPYAPGEGFANMDAAEEVGGKPLPSSLPEPTKLLPPSGKPGKLRIHPFGCQQYT